MFGRFHENRVEIRLGNASCSCRTNLELTLKLQPLRLQQRMVRKIVNVIVSVATVEYKPIRLLQLCEKRRKNNKHKRELWRDASTSGSQSSRSRVPSVPRTFCPIYVDRMSGRRPQTIAGTLPTHATKFLYVFFVYLFFFLPSLMLAQGCLRALFGEKLIFP